MPERVSVFAPATVANVACAFDVLGFAVMQPGDEVDVRLVKTQGVIIKAITGDNGRLSLDPNRNTAGVAVQALLKGLGITAGIEIVLRKNLPLGSGLGSSAASAVAALWATNLLLGSPLSKRELLPFAMEAERVACGSAHADNVAPALLGGFTLIRSYSPLDIVELSIPAELHCTLVLPAIEVRTEDARKILKKEIPLAKAVVQWGNIAGLVAGLCRSDYELIGRSLEDVIIEPERSLLVPGFSEVKAATLAAGALGCSLSGSGPAIFALCRSHVVAEKLASVMTTSFDKFGIQARSFVSAINSEGPKLLSAE